MMSDLLELAVRAHGGLDRWNRASKLDVKAAIGGAIWRLKGWPDHLAETRLAIDPHRPHVEYTAAAAPGQRSIYDPARTAIVADDGSLVGEREAPREAFAGHEVTTTWDAQNLVYFCGYAMWTYMTTPFLLTRPGFEVEEIEPWDGEGELWRRLRVRFPSDVPSHSSEQTFYFDEAGLLRRQDYSVEVMGSFGGASSANYADQPREFDGLIYPTRRRVYRIGEDNLPVRDTVLVAIDILDVDVA